MFTISLALRELVCQHAERGHVPCETALARDSGVPSRKHSEDSSVGRSSELFGRLRRGGSFVAYSHSSSSEMLVHESVPRQEGISSALSVSAVDAAKFANHRFVAALSPAVRAHMRD